MIGQAEFGRRLRRRWRIIRTPSVEEEREDVTRGSREEGVAMRRKSSLLRVTALVAVAVVAFGACAGRSNAPASAAPSGSASTAPSSGAKGTVNIAINPWVGYEADAAVVGYLLKNKLGYTVVEKNLKEEISWQGFETGDVDVILENWGHPELTKTYIEDKKIAVDAGLTGNKGIIGWYVPPWLATEHPDILDWQNLNKYADQFKTSESGGKGQLLDGDPSYVTNDEALVTNLNLNFKVVYAGSEAALIEAFKTAEQQKKWLIGYFYEPQWFLAEVPLAHVKLPPYTPGCDADPKKVACDYPPYDLNKIVSKKFADTGGDAYTLVKNFNWTNEDQNTVAAYINSGMSHDDAGKKWVDANEAKWKAWLPAG
jgi:glycine betaine/proline transport system substrate-binding protein